MFKCSFFIDLINYTLFGLMGWPTQMAPFTRIKNKQAAVVEIGKQL